MKVVYLHQYFNTTTMSGGTRSYEMAKRLVSYGHEVYMITSDRKPKTNKVYKTIEDGIQVTWIPVPYDNHFKYFNRIVSFLQFAIKSAWYAKKMSADLVFATSTPLTIAIPAIFVSKTRCIPMVLEIRDLWPEIPIAIGAIKNKAFIFLTKWLERYAYASSRMIIALSPGMKDGIVKNGISDEKVVVVPNSSDIDMFSINPSECNPFLKKYQYLKNKKIISYIGTFGKINGVKYIVDVANEMLVLSDDILFLLVGDGNERDLVVEYAKERGIYNKNLFIIDPVKKSEVPFVFSLSRITMSTVIDVKELWNNSANKFFDSLAAGKPIAINYEGWQSDILRETGAGIVLPVNDTVVAARLLYEKINDQIFLDNASIASRRLAVEEFSREKMAKKLNEILTSVAHDKSS